MNLWLQELHTTCFLKNGSFDVVDLNINDDTKNLISDHLLLIYTGIRRHASEIEKTKVENIYFG